MLYKLAVKSPVSERLQHLIFPGTIPYCMKDEGPTTLDKESACNIVDLPRCVEITGPPSPLGHGHLRTDRRCVLPVQISGRALEDPKDQKFHISASIVPQRSITYQIAVEFHKQLISTHI